MFVDISDGSLLFEFFVILMWNVVVMYKILNYAEI